MKNLIIFITVLVAAWNNVAFGQQKVVPLRYSFRDGTYLYFADRTIAADAPFETITAVRVSRNTGKGYTILQNNIARVKSADEFKKMTGDVWRQIKLMKKLSSDDAVWKFVMSHPMMNDYGVLAFNINFRHAMGNALLDKEAAGLPTGTRWSYKIEWLDAGGKVLNAAEGTVNGGAGTFELSQAKKIKTSATDSAVFATWGVRIGKNSTALVMADVYRQTGGKGSYSKQPTPLLAIGRPDSLLFYMNDDVVPNTLYRYFIIPTDDLGNASQRSDTVSMLTFDFASLPILSKVTAVDTLNAIVLRWQALGDLPQVTGIEIQRSRDVRGDYVVIDTVEVLKSSYFDTQVFPDVPYYYRLRVLGLKGQEKGTGYAGYATAIVKNKHKHPDPPYNLKGSLVKGKILLQWQGTEDADLYGYFVYRGLSENGSFEVISPALKTLEFIDTSAVNGRTQFVYAVKAVNNNSLESDFSNRVTLRQNVVQLPQAPAGVSAFINNKTVVLDWSSAAKADFAVQGYNIYRRETQTKKDFDLKQSAAAQASALKFILLNSTIIGQTHYEDSGLASGKAYEYAVAALDVFGMESTYSPFASIVLPNNSRTVVTCAVRKVSTGVELSWDPGFSAGAESVIIYRKKAGDATYQKTGSATKAQLMYVDKTAQKGTLYSYLISAEKGTQTIARSEEKNIRY